MATKVTQLRILQAALELFNAEGTAAVSERLVPRPVAPAACTAPSRPGGPPRPRVSVAPS